MLLQDSIHTESIVAPDLPDLMELTPSRPQTPYQVLQLLPKDATPAQQDSAIQAWFKPGEIHYSSEPDTLHLPGHSKGHSVKDVSLPQYYRENYFSKDTLYHPELEGGRFGMAGDPIPYTIRDDNTITGMLIICFVVSLIAFSISKNYILHQVKSFFNFRKSEQEISATSTEIKVQLFFLLQTSLLLSLLYFFYTKQYVASSFILYDEYLLVGIFFGVLIGYFCLKFLLYTMVNHTFFESKKNEQFAKSILFIHAAEGVLLFPAVLLLAFFNLSTQIIAIYFVFILFFVKILTFYKSFVIFFRQNGFFLQIILYFCTLEIVPLFVVWSGLAVIVNALKINF